MSDIADRQRHKIAAVVLLHHDGSTLMQLRDDKPGLRHAGMWVPPGGHCEPGERLEDCARREFSEETGYHSGKLDWLMTFDDGDEQELTVFWAWYDGVQPLRCMEGQALRFIGREQAVVHAIPPYLIEIWDRAIAAVRRTSESKKA